MEPIPSRARVGSSALPIGAVLIWLIAGVTLFGGYFRGANSPGWDFLGGYLTNAYAWWSDGSFFHPPSYMPHLYSGYPASANPQTSAWYLPVGISAWLGSYDSWAAAVLQAITAIVGSLGAGLAAVRLGMTVPAGAIAAIGYLLTPGFFAYSQFVDIVRGWAIIPWLLILVIPRAGARRLYLSFATIVWWQFFIGVYPGSIIAAMYLSMLWVVLGIRGSSSGSRSRYLRCVAVPVGLGLLMSGLKWIPYFAGGAAASGTDGDAVIPDITSLATIVASHSDSAVLGDPALRSFYVLPAVLILAILGIHRTRVCAYAWGTITLSLTLGFGASFIQLLSWLPLMEASRFRIYDFNVGIYLGLSLAAASGFADLAAGRRLPLWKWVLAISVPAAFLSIALVFDLSSGVLTLATRSVLVTIAVVIVAGVVGALGRRGLVGTLPVAAASLVVLAVTVVVGTAWAFKFPEPWNQVRHQSEMFQWGTTSEALIGADDLDDTDRAGRDGPELPVAPDAVGQFWSDAELSGSDSIYGSANLKGHWRGRQYVSMLRDPAQVPLSRALAAPPSAWLADLRSVGVCLQTDPCHIPAGRATVDKWEPGSISVTTTSAQPARVVLNEVAWPGWVVSVCSRQSPSNCTETPVRADPDTFLMGATIPAGTSDVFFDFRQPGMRLAWMTWWIAALSLALLTAFSGFCWRRSKD